MSVVYNTVSFILGSLWRGLDSVSLPFMPGFTLGDFILFPLLFGIVGSAIRSVVSSEVNTRRQDKAFERRYKNIQAIRNKKNNGG